MNITPIFVKSKRTSNALLRDIRRRSSLNRKYEKKTLELLKKSIEERSKTYSALSKRDKEGGGIFGSLFGGSSLLSRLRGRGKGGSGGMGFSGGGPRKPLLPKGGGGIGRNLGRLSKFGKFGRVGPLAILGTGLDFSGRLGSGQNIAQATIGAGGGLAGALAGGAKGAAIGTAFGGPLGTLIGGIIGSGVGAFAGGSIADLLTGVNADRQRESQIFIDKKRREKTLFSGALDQFDDTLKTFEEDTAPTLIAFKKQVDEDDQTVKIPSSIIKPSTPFFQRPAVRAIGITLLAAGLITAAVLTRGRSVPQSQKIIEKILLKSPNLRGLGQTEQLVAVGKLLERTLSKSAQQKIRMRTSPFINKRGNVVPGQKGAPGVSKKGKEIRNLTKSERDELASERFNLRDQRRIRRNKKLEEKIKKQEQEDAQRLKDIENDPMLEKAQETVVRQSGVDVTLDPAKMSREALSQVEAANAFLKRMDPTSKNIRSFNKMLGIKRAELVDKIRSLNKLMEIYPKDSTKIRLKDAKKALKIIDDALQKFAPREIQKKLFNKKRSFENIDLSSNDLEPPDSSIASLPKSNIFSDSLLDNNNMDENIKKIIDENNNIAMEPLLNEESNLTNTLIVMNNPTTIRPMSLGGSGQRTVVIKDKSFDAVAKYAQMTGLLTV